MSATTVLNRLFVLILILALRAAPASELPDTIDKVRPSIVSIGTIIPTRRPPGLFSATGFIVGNGQYVVTNLHAIPKVLNTEKKEVLVIATRQGNKAFPATVVGKDAVHDLAILSFNGPPLPALRLGNSKRVREGEIYAFTGFPIGEVLGLKPVTHRGMISSITPIAVPQLSAQSLDANLIKRLKNPYDVFQLDATAYPGNSGSPLYDQSSGVVIGILNRVFIQSTKEKVLSDPSGIAYAIPIQYAKELLDKAGVAY